MADSSTSSSTPVKRSLIPRACRITVQPENGGLRPSASQERLRHENELSVRKQRVNRASSPKKKKGSSPVLLPTRTTHATDDGKSKVAQGVSSKIKLYKLPQASPKPSSQGDIFKKPQMRPVSRQQDQRASFPTKQYQTIHEVPESAEHQPAAALLVSDGENTPVPYRSRPSLSERTIDTISQIPPSPSPQRRKSSFYSTDSSIRPPSRPDSAMSNEIGRMINAGNSRRHSGLDFGFASLGEGHSFRKLSMQSNVHHTPARRSPSRVSSSSTSSSLLTKPDIGKFTSSIPELNSSNHGQKYSSTDTDVKQRTSTTNTISARRPSVSRSSMQEIRASERNLLLADDTMEDEYTSPTQPEDSSKTSSLGSASASNTPIYLKPFKLTLQYSSHSDTQNGSTNNSCLSSSTAGLDGCTALRHEASHSSWLEMPSEIFRPTPGQRSFSSSSGPFRNIIAAVKLAWPIRNIFMPDDERFVKVMNGSSENDAEDPWMQRELRERVKVAIDSGRLDISGLNLTHISYPIPGLRHIEVGGGPQDNNTLWYEVNDIFNFCAANNRLEIIPDEMFPDVDSQGTAVWNNVESRGPSFTNVMSMDLRNNRLRSIPLGLRRLETLNRLDLSNNNLANSSLEIITQIPRLCELNLANNRLSGVLPNTVSDMGSLFTLTLRGNSLKGLATNIGKMRRLIQLDISDNSMEELPLDIFNMLRLVKLLAASNFLEGALLPAGITEISYLEELDVHHNILTSLMTDSRKTLCCPKLKVLNISMNSIQNLPDKYDWPELTTLNACDNEIGPMLDGITKCKKLQHADFSDNKILYVADDVGFLQDLRYFGLDRNPVVRASKRRMKVVANPQDFPNPYQVGVKLSDEKQEGRGFWRSFAPAPRYEIWDPGEDIAESAYSKALDQLESVVRRSGKVADWEPKAGKGMDEKSEEDDDEDETSRDIVDEIRVYEGQVL
ncbi:MAG: hypothetical protein M1835_002506 [Candelina submexicana]|nr:MAG: hypothetical protein M1835_002506 [Candelina submexicana]